METNADSVSRGAGLSRSLPQSWNDDIGIVPYSQLNGVWTISTIDVLTFAKRAISQGLFRIFEHIKRPEEFLEAMQTPANVPVFCFVGNEMLGVCWLSECGNNRAFVHILFLREAWGRAEEAGRIVLKYWDGFNVDGVPLFDVLLALIPSYNRIAVSYARRVGFTELGEVPKMIRREHPATLLYRVR